MKYYILDTQRCREPVVFNSVLDVVSALEIVVKYKFNLSRKQYMQNLIDLGYGADDSIGRTFTESMADYIEIGVVKNGRCVRCNIHEAAHHAKYINEMGH
jgi:hypothetical protein